jgi:hypothetical protein
VTHHPDCDGYMTVHRSTVEVARPHQLAVATCEECGPLHLCSFGPAAHDVPRRIAAEHASEVECDGRCSQW